MQTSLVNLCLASALFPLLFATGMQAQSLQFGTESQVGPGGLDYLRPRIHLAADGWPVVLWGDAATDAVRSAYFTSMATWPTEEVSAFVQGDPYVADWTGPETASDGTHAWAVYGTGGSADGPLYLHHFMNGYPDAADTLRIDPPIGFEYKLPTVAALPGGEAAILAMSTTTGWSAAEYVLLRTTGGGTALLPPVPVSVPVAPGEVCDCCTGHVLADGNTVVALFRNNNSNLRSIWAAVSTDGGATFTTGAEVDPTAWTIAACPSSGPDAYIVGDSLRMVWMSGAVNGTKSYGRSMHLQTLALGPLVPIHPAQSQSLSQNFPRIAGSGDTLGVVWQQGQAGQFEILISWSVTGWAGLSVPDTVNFDLIGSQKNPDITFRNGSFYMVWQDIPSTSVHFVSAVLVNDVAVPEAQAVPLLHVWPVPTKDVLHVAAVADATQYVVFDALGRELKAGSIHDGAIDVKQLPIGTYSLCMRDVAGGMVGRAVFTIAR